MRCTTPGLIRLLVAVALAFCFTRPDAAVAQEKLVVATVERPPFSMHINGSQTGFSIELLEAVLKDVGQSFSVQRHNLFGDMLDQVRNSEVDIAAANISITAEREQQFDFSQPIFSSGLQIMTHENDGDSIFSVFLSFELFLAIIAAFALLFGGGMLMWWFERDRQEYFDHKARQAAFPAFWWALNLVVNGGFEERTPRSAPGRVLAVFLVVASLFVVSVFVARITSVMTVDAIQRKVANLSDLDGRNVGTIGGSTASRFLTSREIAFETTDDFTTLYQRRLLMTCCCPFPRPD